MKKIIFALVVALLFAVAVQAQVNNIPTGDSSVVINYAYVGLLAQTNFSYDSLYSSSSFSLTTGFQATYKPSSWLSLVAINGYRINEKGTASTFSRFWTKAQYEDYVIELGLVGALSTESRPIFSTAAGQFES